MRKYGRATALPNFKLNGGREMNNEKWIGDNTNIAYRKDWECRKAIFDLRKRIKGGEIDLAEDMDVVYSVCANMPSRFLGPIYGLGIDPIVESGTILDQYQQHTEDNPCRLTGDDLERDFLDGPNAMVDRGVKTEDEYFDHNTGQFRPKVNWDHISKREQERVDLFFSISGAIIRYGNRGMKDKLAGYSKRYWSWIINEKKSRDKSDPVLTQDQAAGIAWLLDFYYKPNKAFKASWSDVMAKISIKRAEKVSADDPTYVDGDEAYGYADSPEEEMMAREEVAMYMQS